MNIQKVCVFIEFRANCMLSWTFSAQSNEAASPSQDLSGIQTDLSPPLNVLCFNCLLCEELF